jgi:hypothetical protein
MTPQPTIIILSFTNVLFFFRELYLRRVATEEGLEAAQGKE